MGGALLSPEALALIEAFERRLERLVAEIVDACFARPLDPNVPLRAPGTRPRRVYQPRRRLVPKPAEAAPSTAEQRLEGIKAAVERLVPPAPSTEAHVLSVDELLARQGRPTEQLEQRLEKIRAAPAARTFAEGTIVVCERGDGNERLGRVLENKPNGLSRVQAVDLRGENYTYGSPPKPVREWVLAAGEIKREAHTYKGVRGRLCYRTFDRATTSSPFPSAGAVVVVLPPGLRNVS